MDLIKFGTDGVRGRAATAPIDAQSMFYIGCAAGQVLGKGGGAILARDTRRSSTMLEAAISAGLAATGVDVLLGGVLPTAALSLAVRTAKADLGIMITASHNPATDNGVKIFAAGGSKIPDRQQSQIETLINNPGQIKHADAPKIGRVRTEPNIVDAYLSAVRALMPARPLAGLKLVVDCANGANSHLAPKLLAEAGATIIAIHNEPDGDNINLNCGSTHPEELQAKVRREQADAGIAFDGDADRVLLVDEQGDSIDGDQILARLATDWQKAGTLRGNRVVATVMSNMGLERYLQAIDLQLERTPVGDRHVAARLSELRANLGGEQSGHILTPHILPSGDGLIAGLLPLISLARSHQRASQHLRPFTPLPQLLHNVRYSGGNPLIDPIVKTAIRQAVHALGKTGRVLVRASGTEPLIRVMAEAEEEAEAEKAIQTIIAAIAKVG